MPAKVDFEKDLPKAEKRVDDLDKGLKKLATMQNKKYAEFETLRGALMEGKDVIAENQKAIKKEKDPKKISALATEMEEQEKTFEKIAAKLKPIVKELGDMGTTAGNLKRSMQEEYKALQEMEKELKRTGGDMKEIKAWADTIKTLCKTLDTAADKAASLAEEPKSLPDIPKL